MGGGGKSIELPLQWGGNWEKNFRPKAEKKFLRPKAEEKNAKKWEKTYIFILKTGKKVSKVMIRLRKIV